MDWSVQECRRGDRQHAGKYVQGLRRIRPRRLKDQFSTVLGTQKHEVQDPFRVHPLAFRTAHRNGALKAGGRLREGSRRPHMKALGLSHANCPPEGHATHVAARPRFPGRPGRWELVRWHRGPAPEPSGRRGYRTGRSASSISSQIASRAVACRRQRTKPSSRRLRDTFSRARRWSPGRSWGEINRTNT